MAESVDAPVIDDPRAAVSAALRPPAKTSRLRGMYINSAGWTAISIASLVVVWGLAVVVFQPPEYILPAPWAVASCLWTDFPMLMEASVPTVSVILVGFTVSVVVAVPLGLLIVALPWLDRLLYPILVSFNSIPKVALAPLFVVWFGYGMLPRVVIAFSIAFFPILVNTVSGIKGVDPDMVRLARSMGASKLRTFTWVRLPNAMPTIFAGLKVASGLAVIGGIIGEFVASDAGLGYLLLQAQGQFDTVLIFAIVLLLAVFATLLYYSVELIERLVIPWHSSQRG